MSRCPFSLSKLVKVTETGWVIHKAEKDGRVEPDSLFKVVRSDASIAVTNAD
jgi:hypothetical protein